MIDVTIDRNAEKPLYAQIRDALTFAIGEGRLKPGDQLPTVASFAERIGVTQCTVRRAYEDLTKKGSVSCQVGRGTFVSEPPEDCGRDSDVCTCGASPAAAPQSPLNPEFKKAARRLRMGIAKSLQKLFSLGGKPGIINLTSGVPDPGLAEEGVLKEMAMDALSADNKIYGRASDPMGLIDLRRVLADRFNKSGADITPDQIIITTGSQQAVALTALAAMETSHRIVCETPCYTGIPNAYSAYGHWVETIPRDQDGPLPDRLNRFADGRPTLLYTCPELHNPMGTDISPQRRSLLKDWAHDNNSVIVADEIFRDLRYDGPAPNSMLKDIGVNHTVVVGSISKSFMSGIRIGWLVSDQERIRTIAPLKKCMDLASPPLMQGIVLSLFNTGVYDEHVDRVRNVFRERRDALVRSLKMHMPEAVTWTVPKGGFNMWLELPQGYSSIALFLMAVERGVAFIPGPYTDIDHRFVNAVRLSFGDVGVEQIQEGVELLAYAVKDMLTDAPNDLGLSGLGDFL